MKNILRIASLMLLFPFILCGCGSGNDEPEVKALPAPESDPGNMFGVDKNINMSTIDEWLGRD
ncbi:MAG: hypothetical protein IKD81_06765, partial [Eubacteriaceae bacterium]|nr:hypothetical protein [Eubacteriaceae bacterium]